MQRSLNILSKLHFRIIAFKGKLRRGYYKSSGMAIGENTFLNKIEVDSPASVEIGKDCLIGTNTAFWIQSPFKKENRIVIGNNVFIGRNTEFNCCDFISIGNNCLIASSTVFVDSTHTYLKGAPITEQPTVLRGITVEEDVWIGTGSKILYGVHLGKGCIIGAGAVVNKSVPDYEIWAGVPAKKISERAEKAKS